MIKNSIVYKMLINLFKIIEFYLIKVLRLKIKVKKLILDVKLKIKKLFLLIKNFKINQKNFKKLDCL